jgi:D-galactarolactone cycloisomerase
LLEYDQSNHPFRQDLIFSAIGMKNGRITIPDSPGIGIEVSRSLLRENAKS